MTEAKCEALPDLFFKYDDRLAAAHICEQCSIREWCYKDAVEQGTRSAVRGGVWFNRSGEPVKVRVLHKRPFQFTLNADEDATERALRQAGDKRSRGRKYINEAQTEYDLSRLTNAPTVKTRHQVWKMGRTCQETSVRMGDRCNDYDCVMLARKQWRENNRKRRAA